MPQLTLCFYNFELQRWAIIQGGTVSLSGSNSNSYLMEEKASSLKLFAKEIKNRPGSFSQVHSSDKLY